MSQPSQPGAPEPAAGDQAASATADVVAFVGLGRMGLPMAARLAEAGVPLRAFDTAPAARASARALGLPVADSIQAAAEGADVVCTMLPQSAHVLECYAAILGELKDSAVLVDCSTAGVAGAAAIHAAARERGLASLDAPVSGGVDGAAAGTLTFMVGGGAADLARVEPLLAAMGRRVFHCGPHGAGQAAKICNNLILGASMVAVSEAFVLGEALGLSAQSLYDVASTSSGSCFALTQNCPAPGPRPASPANHGYQAGFAGDLMLKDLRLAQAAAQEAGVAARLCEEAASIYARFSAEGRGALDFSGVIVSIRESGAAP
jgi:3-hydroxyisobutyrate dehydrogenase